MREPLTGHRGGDGWCNLEAPDPKRQAVVRPDGMLQIQVRFGDQYQNPNTGQWYTEQRALLTAVNQTTFLEGQEHWLGWTTEYPADWIGVWPKQDELRDWPRIHLDGGSCVEFHQQPAPGAPYYGDWNKMPGGSAPIYTGVSDTEHYLSLTDRETRSHSVAAFHLPLERGRRNQHILHAKWSADPGTGFLEYWINGVKMVGDADGPFRSATMYEGCTNYLVAGIYRRLSVGDPGLVWPMDATPGVDYPHGFVPRRGARIYQKDDGYPSVMLLGAVTVATSRDDLPACGSPPPPSPVDPVKARDGLRILIDEKQRLLAAVAQLTSCISQLEALQALARDLTAVRDDLTRRIEVIGDLLDRGPW